MQSEIVATGDEIRTGALVDSNSAYLAEQLERQGIVVSRHHSVGDDLESLTAVLAEVSQRAELAVVTGGLGPTVDDRTAEALARAGDLPLVMDKKALSQIEQFFERLGRTCTPSNHKQAMLPQGATCLYNPIGTAPGFSLKLNKCTFFCLPGVPPEMEKMFTEKALPLIAEMQGPTRQFSMVKTLSSFGLPESLVGEKVAEIEKRFPRITLGLRAKFPEIQVKLYLQTRDEEQGNELLDQAAQWVRRQLGTHVFSDQGQTMAAAVGQLLQKRKATLAVAESCTGGLVANWLTNTAGSSDYFLLSAVTYDNEAKVSTLGVSMETLMAKGAVHEETARQMATGARRLANATYALATTGIAGPSGGSPEKPVGMVCIALATEAQCIARTFTFHYEKRLVNKRIFAMTALNMLRKHLLEKRQP